MQVLPTKLIPLDESIDIPQTEGTLTIRAADVRYWMEELKVINKTQAVYLGLKIWYPKTTAIVDIVEFCDVFGITEGDFHKAIADLTKKKALHETTPERYVQLNLFPKQETDQT